MDWSPAGGGWTRREAGNMENSDMSDNTGQYADNKQLPPSGAVPAAEPEYGAPQDHRLREGGGLKSSEDHGNHRGLKVLKAMDPSRHPARALLLDGFQWVGKHPLAVSLAVSFLLYNIVIRAAISRHINFRPLLQYVGHEYFRTSYRQLIAGRWYTAVASIFFVDDIPQMIIGVITILFAVSIAESHLGLLRAAATGIVCCIIGLSSGLALCYLIQGHGRQWHVLLDLSLSYGPGVLVIGPLMAAGAAITPLWRRRLYIFTYAVILAGLLYRGEPIDYVLLIGAFVGQACGFMFVRKAVQDFVIEPIQAIEVWRILSIITVIAAVGPLIAVTSPIHAGPLSDIGLLLGPSQADFAKITECMQQVHSTGCYMRYGFMRVHLSGVLLVSLLPVVISLIIAWGIYRGRRTAVHMAIVWNLGIIILSEVYYFVLPVLLESLAYGEQAQAQLGRALSHGTLKNFAATCLLPFILIIVYITQIRRFHIRTRPALLYSGAAVIGATFIALSLVYFLVVKYTPNPLPGDGTDYPEGQASSVNILISLMVRYLPIGFLGLARLASIPLGPVAGIVAGIIGPIVWTVTGVIFVLWFSDHGSIGMKEHQKASGLVEAGGESMSFMATWEGNDYWFSASGRSAIAYRVNFGIALTVTGPFGEPAEYKQDIIDFTKFCDSNSWMPVFYAVHEEQRKWLEELKWNSLDVGTEMVIDPRQWKTAGKKWQDVRTAINKAKREGITDVLSTYQDATFDIRSQIMTISEEWAEDKSLPEMKFTLGGIEELMDPRVKLLYAIDGEGTVQAVTSWLPVYREGRVIGWTLDFMRHRQDAINGIMEFLIARMAERLRDGQSNNPNGPAADPRMRDIEFLSLSAAPLSGIRPIEGKSASLTHILQMTANMLEPAYGFRSLLFFKKKFQPAENHVYIAYPDSSRLPQLALAVTRAYLPDMKIRDVMSLVGTFTRNQKRPDGGGQAGKEIHGIRQTSNFR